MTWVSSVASVASNKRGGAVKLPLLNSIRIIRLPLHNLRMFEFTNRPFLNPHFQEHLRSHFQHVPLSSFLWHYLNIENLLNHVNAPLNTGHSPKPRWREYVSRYCMLRMYGGQTAWGAINVLSHRIRIISVRRVNVELIFLYCIIGHYPVLKRGVRMKKKSIFNRL